jgi:hypothetical protein
MTRTQCAALAVMLLTCAPTFCADLTVRIDARDVIRRHLQTHETLAVKPGPLVLVYPKWIPAEHAPAGPLDSIIGLEIKAKVSRSLRSGKDVGGDQESLTSCRRKG